MSLPSGYKRLEYIQSSGTQYIDTGFIPNQDTRIDIDVIPLSIAETSDGAGFIPYGAGVSNSNRAFECYSSRSQYEFNYDGQCNFVGSPSVGQRLKISHNKNKISLIVNSGTPIAFSFTYQAFTAPYTMTLFAIHRSRPLRGLMKLYSCQIYDNGTLIRDYIPCQKPDDTIGLWDNVNSVFYGNAGTGTFTADASEITKLKYIQSSGTQYIDTGFVCNGNSKIEAEFEVLDASNNGAYLYGGGSGSARIEAYPWAGTMEMNYGSLASFVGSIVANKKFYLCQDKGNFHFSYPDGSGSWTQEGETQSFNCVVPMAIFVLNRGSIYYPVGGMRLYWFKIYDNGTLVRDFIPCQTASGDIGLWDNVNSVFYGNAGTGTFTAGPSSLNLPVNIGGTWKDANEAFVNIGGTWKTVEAAFVNIGGTWKELG